MADLLVCHLGRVPYEEGVEIQELLRSRVQEGELGEVLLLLEHDPVYTLGRRSEPGELGLGEEWCHAQGIDVVKTQRGGKLTYHGPGQLVGYPIMRVGDVPAFVATMERAIVDALAEAGVTAHGFAVNVNNDVAPFHQVTACGLPGVQMTSIALETGRTAGLDCFRKRVAHAYAQAHGLRQRIVTRQRLERVAVPA